MSTIVNNYDQIIVVGHTDVSIPDKYLGHDDAFIRVYGYPQTLEKSLFDKIFEFFEIFFNFK